MSEIIQMNGQEWKITKKGGETIKYERVDHLTTDQVPSPFYTEDTITQESYRRDKTPELYIVDAVISRSGVYPYPERKRNEAKLPEDLKEATKFIQYIPGFDRHPKDSERGLNALLGTVQNITFDPKNKGIRAKDILWRERVEQYATLQDALESKKPFPVSIGQWNVAGPPGVLDSVPFQASQKGILLDHLAHLVDGSEPRCSLGVCGLNIDTVSNDSLKALDEILKKDPKKPCPLKNFQTDLLLNDLIKQLTNTKEDQKNGAKH